MSNTPKRSSTAAKAGTGTSKRAKQTKVSESPFPPSATRTERFEVRLTPAQRALLAHAATLGHETVTQFVVRTAVRAARRKLVEDQPLLLSARDRAALVRALLQPPAPNEALRAAHRIYRTEHAD